MQIETNLFARQITTKKVSNFSTRLPKPQSDLANYLMKDPYIFDMMGLTDKMAERDVERQLVSHITKYLLEMSSGFIELPRNKFGDVLLSQSVTTSVPSALRGFTSVFGMGTGVPLLPLSPYFSSN